MFTDIISVDDILEGLNNYTKLYIDTAPKKYYRKIRTKGKIKKTHIVCVNRLHDYLLPPSLILKPLRSLYKKN